ncbi:unnamed protein product [Schistocephalus solidus]|uniref:NR LBD domain-containing protein n=1 Tax=Schistocephalus solidus TaxID=70667 RepID=A0A183STJ5_SCHSO|nr:unnamed protein product [Schistocephalus solidus]
MQPILKTPVCAEVVLRRTEVKRARAQMVAKLHADMSAMGIMAHSSAAVTRSQIVQPVSSECLGQMLESHDLVDIFQKSTDPSEAIFMLDDTYL